MPAETVRIVLQDTAVPAQPVDGVGVRVYDAAGATLITSAVSGAVVPGEAEVTLAGDDPPVEYQLRFHVVGGSIPSPQRIEVYSPPSASPTGTNRFGVTAEMFDPPPAADPRLCRVSGYVRTPDGRARTGLGLHFIHLASPVVVDGALVSGERVSVKTDDDGYAQVDLYRTGRYLVTVEGYEDFPREVLVPDQSSLRLGHLLFERVAEVTFTPSGPWSLSVDQVLEVTPVVRTTAARVLDGHGGSDVRYSTDDPSIASVILHNGSILLRGHAPGTTALRLARRDDSIRLVPDTDISGGLVTITVT